MKLTHGERLITVMLADIMEHFEINGEVDPTFIKRVVTGNEDWALKWKYGGIFHNEEPTSEAEVNETASILSMMSFIEFSVSKLPENERAEFEANRALQFRGFDGNHDPHFGVALTLIEDLNRFSEFQDRELNSHGAARAQSYLRMKPAYDDAMRSGGHDGLSADQLRTIAAAYDRY